VGKAWCKRTDGVISSSNERWFVVKVKVPCGGFGVSVEVRKEWRKIEVLNAREGRHYKLGLGSLAIGV
jgi:hypothetical protein